MLLFLLAQLLLIVNFLTSCSGLILLVIAIGLFVVARKWSELDVVISPLLAVWHRTGHLFPRALPVHRCCERLNDGAISDCHVSGRL